VLQRLVEPDLRDRYARAADALTDLRRPPDRLLAQPDPREARSRSRALVRLDLPAAPRPLTKVAQTQLRGKATLRAFKTMGLWGFFMATTAAIMSSSGSPALLLVAALATIGASGALAFAHGHHKDLELHRNGIATQGHIYDVRRDVVGNRLYARVLYDFVVADARYVGELDASESAARQVQVDDPLLIIYDPHNPRRHLATLVR
jgi:hypothetical protein